jgi:hypothetical protein
MSGNVSQDTSGWRKSWAGHACGRGFGGGTVPPLSLEGGALQGAHTLELDQSCPARNEVHVHRTHASASTPSPRRASRVESTTRRRL